MAAGGVMDERRRRYAGELLERSRAFDATRTDRLERYRNVEPETAELLGVLVRACRPGHVLEIGTSNGYSTIWLADASEAVGAELLSVDVDARRSEEAREHLTAVGLAAELRVEDAAETLRASPDGHWGFVFLDAERPAYAAYWPELVRTLAPGGLLAIDNVLSHAEQVKDVTGLILAEPRVSSTLLSIGAGVRLVVRG
jgi:predicted O-methyltransferase YrrM